MDISQRVFVKGHHSGWRTVTSGVPQGSVLDPILIFINDLEWDIRNLVFKFAHDTKFLGKVDSSKYRDLLQNDLDRLMQWSDR